MPLRQPASACMPRQPGSGIHLFTSSLTPTPVIRFMPWQSGAIRLYHAEPAPLLGNQFRHGPRADSRQSWPHVHAADWTASPAPPSRLRSRRSSSVVKTPPPSPTPPTRRTSSRRWPPPSSSGARIGGSNHDSPLPENHLLDAAGRRHHHVYRAHPPARDARTTACSPQPTSCP